MEEKRSKRILLLAVFAILNLCFYGIFCVEHFAADTYLTEVWGWEKISNLYWQNGRWLMTLLCEICQAFHIGFHAEKTISWVLAISFLSLAELLLYEIIKRRIHVKETLNIKHILVFLSSFMMISNLFVLEYFIFAEYTGAICVGIFFNILEVRLVLKFLERGEIKDYILGLVCGIFGIMGHQGAFGITAVLLILLAENTFLNVKNFIKNSIIIGMAYLVPALTNTLQTKLAGSARVAGSLDVVGALKTAMEQIGDLLISTANFMPKSLYLVLCGVAGMVVLVMIIVKRKGKALLHAAYVFLVFILAGVAPFLMTDTAYISVVPRTVYVLGAGFPVLLILLLLLENLSKKLLQGVVLYVGIFLGIQYFNTCQIETSHYVSNGIDYYDVNYIEQQVWIYENETGNQISKIKIYTDESPLGIYYNLTGYGAVNERVMSNSWAAADAYRIFTGREMTVEESDTEVYEKFFKGKNWHYLDDEQIVLIGDTLHLCLY